ncbi:MAG: A/G-specific adenine glycosylase [Alphaproteobacteria bacterium]
MVLSSTALKNKTDVAEVFRKKMLDWYDLNRRVLPWRALSGGTPDPYHVWLSEVMLQQTTVRAVIPYFLKFIKRWPDVHALAAADNDDVMAAWAGLGYYARARNLHKCAKVVSGEFGGVFPDEIDALRALPGIGDYTSAAILSIAFDKSSVVIDGNVDRVMARYHAVETPFPAGKKDVKELADFYAGGFTDRPADYAQSLMDLGAGVCTPKSPGCSSCPLNDGCKAFGRGEDYPKKAPKKVKPHKYGYVYWITNDCGDVLVQRRSGTGMLGGMLGLPTSDWLEDQSQLKHLDFQNIRVLPDSVRHVFTHFSLELQLFYGNVDSIDCSSYFFCTPDDFFGDEFPTLFKKSIRLF